MKVLIGILACEKFRARQDYVRKSWVLDMPDHPEFDYCFAMGNPKNGEAQRIGDIVYLPCDDGYKFLVFKSLALIKYAYDQGYDYLFKCDDDTYICLERLSKCGFEQWDYAGKEINKKDGKGYASGGAGYFLSRKAMKMLLEHIEKKPFEKTKKGGGRWCEDSKIGNTVVHEVGIPLHDIKQLDTGLGGATPPKKSNDIITSHYVKDEALVKVYNDFDESAPKKKEPRVYSLDGRKYVEVKPVKTSNKRIAYNGDLWDCRDAKLKGEHIKNSVAAHAPHILEITTEYAIDVSGFMNDSVKGRTKSWLIDFLVNGKVIGKCATYGEKTESITLQKGKHTLEVRGKNCGGGHTCWRIDFHGDQKKHEELKEDPMPEESKPEPKEEVKPEPSPEARIKTVTTSGDLKGTVALFGITVHKRHGPGKMTHNLIKGLQEIGVPSVINRPKEQQQYGEWNNCLCGFCGVNFETLREDVVLGPCIWNAPSDNGGKRQWKIVTKFDRYLCASEWHRNLFRDYPKNEGRMKDKKFGVWGVGVETNRFGDFSSHNKTKDCLVYRKKRPQKDLDVVLQELDKRKQSYILIDHKRKYTEEEFIEAMKQCRYCVVVDQSETQGIALMEILSANLPMLIFDWPVWNLNPKIPATTLEYFDDRCGVKTNLEKEGFKRFQEFLDRLKEFKPREFILEDWTLKRSAERYLEVMKELCQ